VRVVDQLPEILERFSIGHLVDAAFASLVESFEIGLVGHRGWLA